MSVQVTGRPLVAVALTLVDAEGLEVPMLFSPGDGSGTVGFEKPRSTRARRTPG